MDVLVDDLYFIIISDASPTESNTQSSCSVVLNRETISYDITFRLTLDETFTPAVISAIQFLRNSLFEIDENGNPIPTTVVDRTFPLENVTQGPVTILIPYPDVPQLLDGHGYFLSVSIITSTEGLGITNRIMSCGMSISEPCGHHYTMPTLVEITYIQL